MVDFSFNGLPILGLDYILVLDLNAADWPFGFRVHGWGDGIESVGWAFGVGLLFGVVDLHEGTSRVWF